MSNKVNPIDLVKSRKEYPDAMYVNPNVFNFQHMAHVCLF